MSNPSATLLSLEASLHTVIDCLIDGQKGLKKIGEELQNPTLKLFFLDESLVRAEFRGDLESILHHEGVHDIAEGGTVAATLGRVWGEIKATLDGGDQSLLETAEQEQLAAMKAYTQALIQELPYPVRQTLLSQAARIQLFHDFVQGVRQLSNALASN